MQIAVAKIIHRKTVKTSIYKLFGQRLLPLFCLLFSVFSFAITDLSSEPGIRHIFQDNKGFIWLAGQKGLHRFDGSNVIKFSNSPSNWSIPFNWVKSVHAEQDSFYLGTENNGLWKFNPENGDISQLAIAAEHSHVPHVVKLKDVLFYAPRNNVYRFDEVTKANKLVTQLERVTVLTTTSKYLYAGNGNLLQKIDPLSLTVVKEISQSVYAATAIENKVFLLTAEGVLSIADDGSVNTSQLAYKPLSITISSDRSAILVIDDKGQLTKLSITDLSPLPHNFSLPETARSGNIFLDNSGTLWVATSQGVKTFVESPQQLHSAIFDVPINVIKTEVYQDTIWIGSYGQGIAKLQQGNVVLDEDVNQLLGARSKEITDLKVVNNTMFINTFDGLWHYDLQSKNLTNIALPITDQLLLGLQADKNNLYVTTNTQGVLILNLADLTDIKIINGSQLSAPEAIEAIPVNDESLWIATSNGIDIYDLNSQKVQKLSMPSKHKAVALAYVGGKVYAATKGDGLFVYNVAGELIDHLAQGLDISNLGVIGNTLWLSARPGLYQMSPNARNATLVPNTQKYSFTDEIQSFNGNLIIGNFAGVLELKKQDKSTFNAKIVIGETIVSGKHEINQQAINVSSANDVVDLRLASMDYRTGPPKKFKYRINGGTWVNLSTNQLTLTGLAPGQYNIEIMGTNSLGQWSNYVALASVAVKFPWYWTTEMKIAYLVMTLFLAIVGGWLIYLRARSISAVYRELNANKHLKGDTLFKTVHKLKMIRETLEHNPTETTTAIALIDQSIKGLQDYEEQQNKPDSLFGNSLHKSLPYLKTYLHDEFNVSFAIYTEFDESILPVTLQSDLYNIVFEACESAIKSANVKNLKLTLKDVNEKLWLTISDDCNCFSQYNSKINFTMSMYYIRKVAALYDASVNTFDDAIEGSQMIISFPLHDKYRLNQVEDVAMH